MGLCTMALTVTVTKNDKPTISQRTNSTNANNKILIDWKTCSPQNMSSNSAALAAAEARSSGRSHIYVYIFVFVIFHRSTNIEYV